MSTATAIRPRETNTKNKFVTMELVPALPEDVKEFSGWKPDGAKKHTLRRGLIYWLYSKEKKQLEETPRIITPHDDPTEILQWLSLNMIFIAKNEFNYTTS